MGEGRPVIAFQQAMWVNLLIRNAGDASNNPRGRLDIIADILNGSIGGAKKTHLMYHCNLSFKQLKSYSHFLLKQGFLRTVNYENGSEDGFFEVTDKGRRFLKAYRGLKSLMQ